MDRISDEILHQILVLAQENNQSMDEFLKSLLEPLMESYTNQTLY